MSLSAEEVVGLGNFENLPRQKQYLLLVAAAFYEGKNSSSVIPEYPSALSLLRTIDKKYCWGVLSGLKGEHIDALLVNATDLFVELGFLKRMRSDGYSPEYFVVDVPNDFFATIRGSAVYSKIGAAGGKVLRTALTQVAIELETTDEVNSGKKSQEIIADYSETIQTESSDEWSPLKIERSPEELELDLDTLDVELSKIEGDNGYAATNPDERNAIVKPARGVWQAIKDGGMPSKEAVKSTLLTPFRYLTKKFADAAIGIAAKNIVALALKFLSGT